METVKFINPVEDARWNGFVANHQWGWICHLSEWQQVLEKSFPHMKGYYPVIVDEETQQIKAGMPVFLVKSWLTGKRFVSIPFATLCDPLISSGEELETLLDAILNLSQRMGGKYVEIRSLASSHLVDKDRLGSRLFYKHHFLVLDNEPEHLKKKFHRTCVRQRISRAIDSGLTLRTGDCEADLASFYQLFVKTRKRLCLPPLPYSFFKSLWETFSPTDKISLLIAEKDGIPLAGLILFKFRDRVSAEFAASDETFKNLSPNHFLFWEAIKSAYEDGYRIFDFGRTSPYNKSLMDFKRHWGTQVVDLPQHYYPKQMPEKLSCEKDSKSYRFVKGLCKTVPEFAFERIGGLCYRHWG
ncbi:MAG: FemAB family protein [Syntrophus sp. PtaB.Bin001]|nr:MAG: FemAB family protein [Syntrophus sp. PtaB.Bin001]